MSDGLFLVMLAMDNQEEYRVAVYVENVLAVTVSPIEEKDYATLDEWCKDKPWLMACRPSVGECVLIQHGDFMTDAEVRYAKQAGNSEEMGRGVLSLLALASERWGGEWTKDGGPTPLFSGLVDAITGEFLLNDEN